MITVINRQATTGFEVTGPDLTALLDVLFMLIIFFLLTSNSAQQVFELDLPVENNGHKQTLTSSEPLMLYLFSGRPHWRVGDKYYDQWPQVESRLANALRLDSELEIVIAGDRNAPLQRVIQAIDFMKTEGINTTQILVTHEGNETQ